MLDAQATRGPDGSDLLRDGPAVLGHRRLAIIDLSDAAREPLPNEDHSIWVTFNGEIYNFVELRAELVALGHRFRSRTDGEVLVHGTRRGSPGSPPAARPRSRSARSTKAPARARSPTSTGPSTTRSG
ncbi:MAG: hypothetical protein DMD79_04060 [Candidatus Rokuibacteriota bacterium]|nr:MAG: hypothetical protein DMD79_04060 [Candidatus Rokubacteria bacterium]